MFVVSIQVEVCLRYKSDYQQDFLHEADMANILRHKNIIALYGVVIASSYSPSLALVSFPVIYMCSDKLYKVVLT